MSREKIKHVGLHADRLERESLERIYAKEWAELAPRTLGFLIGDEKAYDYSPRDAAVAATIIQWLGSAIGSSFVEDVLSKRKSQ